MNFQPPSTAETTGTYLLRFISLYDRGRGIAVPCDAAGNVDTASLSLRLRLAYLRARLMVGREYSRPTVQPKAGRWIGSALPMLHMDTKPQEVI